MIPRLNYSIFSSRFTKLTALVIILVGFRLRLFNLGVESLWYDELLQVNLALADIPSLLRRLPAHTAVPLDYFISHYWIILGNSEFWVRIPAVVIGTLTLAAVYQLGRSLLDSGSGLLLMALLTFSPFHLRYSQEVRPYALGVFGVILFGYFVWRLRATGDWRYLLPMQLAALIFSLSHYFAVTIFSPWLIFLGIDAIFNERRRNSLKALSGVLVTGAICLVILLGLGWGPTLFKVSGTFGETLINPEQFTATPEEKPNLGTGPQISQAFIKWEILGPLGAGTTSGSLWLFNGLVILGLVSLIAQKRGKLGLLLFLWMIVPPVGIIAFLVHRGTFFATRYIIFILPAYFTLLSVGILTLPRLIKRTAPTWLAAIVFLAVAWVVFADLNIDVRRIHFNKDKENWRLVGEFLTANAGPDDAIIAVKAEPTMNWYYPLATADGNTYSKLEVIQGTVAQAERSWVILSVYSSGIDSKIRAWLSDSEQGAVKLVLDPVITVYYLGHDVDKDQLLSEIQDFALPIDHALYASLARENRRHPEIARQYYQLAVKYAPDDDIRAEYEAALNR